MDRTSNTRPAETQKREAAREPVVEDLNPELLEERIAPSFFNLDVSTSFSKWVDKSSPVLRIGG